MNLEAQSSKRYELFKFSPNIISKIKPYGNLMHGTAIPRARSGHRIVADRNDIYLFGGYNPDMENDDGEVPEYALFKELWRFNLDTQTWTLLKTKGKMPEELASHSVALFGNNLLVYGGTGVPFGQSSSNHVNVCNLNKLEWSLLQTSGSAPLELYGQAIQVYNNKLFVIGGTSGFEYFIDINYLDLSTLEWVLFQQVELEPSPRYRHEIAIKDDEIFVFGGGTASTSFGLKKIPVFNIENKKWRKVNTYGISYPSPRRCHACVQDGNDVYISGGFDGESSFDDIWRLNLNTMQWTKLVCQLPSPLYFHSAALSSDGRMFIFGGITKDKTRTNDLLSIWLKFPSLLEISWEALLYCIPNIQYIDKKHLLAMGIPLNCVKQIGFKN